MKTTTNAIETEADRLARKAVISRQLTDPLGRLGFRRTRTRIEREAGARRAAFVVTLGAFAASFLMIAGHGNSSVSVDAAETTIAPRSAITADDDAVIRLTLPQADARTPHTRTRAS